MKKLFDEKIYESEFFEVHQDWEVPIKAFCILAAKRHLRTIMEFTDAEQLEFSQVLVKVRRAMKEALGIEDVYFFQNEDSKHGFHIWIFPRFEWMERFGRRIQSVRPIMEYAQQEMCDNAQLKAVREAAQKLREYLG